MAINEGFFRFPARVMAGNQLRVGQRGVGTTPRLGETRERSFHNLDVAEGIPTFGVAPCDRQPHGG
jgi:hypothetical protein